MILEKERNFDGEGTVVPHARNSDLLKVQHYTTIFQAPTKVTLPSYDQKTPAQVSQGHVGSERPDSIARRESKAWMIAHKRIRGSYWDVHAPEPAGLCVPG